MEILKCGSEANKARLSFKLIARKHATRITEDDFKQFLNDFFLSWSSLTNIAITEEIRDRTTLFLTRLFRKIEQDTGRRQIQSRYNFVYLRYYIHTLYKDKEFSESFEFITQGMADMFINDPHEQQNDDATALLYKVLTDLKTIGSIFQSSEVFENEQNSLLPNSSDSFQQYSPQIPPSASRIPSKMRSNIFASQLTKKKEKEGIDQNEKQEKIKISGMKLNEVTNKKEIRNKNKEGIQYNEMRKERKNEERENKKGQKVNEESTFQDNSDKAESPREYFKRLSPTYYSAKAQRLEKQLEWIKKQVQRVVSEHKDTYQRLMRRREEQQEKARGTRGKAALNVHKQRQGQAQGQMVFFGDEGWNMMLNMMIGIQMAVRSVKGFQAMIYEEPRDFNLKYYFELVPRRFGEGDDASFIFSFTDYAPNAFNRIRQVFSINNEEYIDSIGPNRLMASLMMGEVNSMTTLTSQGKSGSFFYYTADGKYMLKTIRHRQYKFLRSILPSYFQHLMTHPNSLITKFFGLHKLVEKNSRGEQANCSYFVIMANVFNTPAKIIERYDLKGSAYNRDTNDPDPDVTRKDNDFLKRSAIKLAKTDRQQLLRIINADVQFFVKHEIIDYSLLVGVVSKTNQTEANVKSGFLQRDSWTDYMKASQPLWSANHDEQYILGIIDILTLYDSRKKLQYFFKSTFLSNEISAVPTLAYAERFNNFMRDKVFIEQQ